jgi:adhesin transport system outer membrane protein
MADDGATSLEEAIRITLETNPEIGAAADNRQAVREELRQARGLYLPQVDLSAGVGPEWTSDQTTRLAGDDPEELTRSDADITLTQRIFDGFETRSEINRQLARSRAAAFRVAERAEFIALDAIGAYLEVIRQRQLLRLSQDNVRFHAQILAKVQQRVEGGAGDISEVTQTRARLSRAQATLAQTANDLGDAEANYTRITGQFADELIKPVLPADVLPASIEQTVDLATTDNPTVRIREMDVQTAESDVGVAASALYPDLNLEGRAAYRNDAGGIETYEYDANLQLRLRWNIFRGGINRHARQEALAREAQARNERYDAIRSAQEQARRSWFAYQASQQRLKDLTEAVEFNIQTRDAYEQQFTVGQRTLLDVLDAENDLFTSRGQLISAEINQIRSGYRLLANTGQLLNSLEIQKPEMANPATESIEESLF